MTAAAAKTDTTEEGGEGGTEAESDGVDAAVRIILEGNALAETALAETEAASDGTLAAGLEVDGWDVSVRVIMVEGGTLVDAAPKAEGTEEELLAETTGTATEVELTATVEVDDCEAVRLARILDASSGERVRVEGGSVVGWAPTVTVTVTIFGFEFAPFVTEGGVIVDS